MDGEPGDEERLDISLFLLVFLWVGRTVKFASKDTLTSEKFGKDLGMQECKLHS